MKTFTLLSFVIVITVFLSSCSMKVQFVIENLSRGNIVIKYQTKNLYYGDLTPSVKNLNESNEEKSWEELAQDKYKIDAEKGIVEISLAPDQAFKLAEVDPFWIHHEPYSDHFNVKSLSIVGDNGSIKIEGNQVIEIFQSESKGYYIRYKESPNIEL